MSKHCRHVQLDFNSSTHVHATAYHRSDENRRTAATQLSGQVPSDLNGSREVPSTFPAPLVLPEDDLALNGRYPAQSVRSWSRGEYRNRITPDRNTIYVIAPPAISEEVAYMQTWSRPQVAAAAPSRAKKSRPGHPVIALVHPQIGDIAEYFRAFFHGMNVETLDDPWRFTEWETSDRPQRQDQREAVALETNKSIIRIRTRASLDGCFVRQLNLTDLLDACIEAVPADAYAVLLLVEQDMFEDADDDFCCGRAYGGSRVAVVSTARYHPTLDKWQGVERQHAWPASHCSAYMEGSAESTGVKRKRRTASANSRTTSSSVSAMQAAVNAFSALSSLDHKPSVAALEGLWLGRVCKTGAHEVGHCLGMDHCVYYACLMQGTANICEDARQPPYLCPVDLAKYVRASGANVVDRYEALLAFCDSRSDMHWCAAFAAWLRGRVTELQSKSRE